MRTVITTLFTAMAIPVMAAEFVVSPSGHDTAAGSAAHPFATLQKACDAARSQPGSTIWVHGGTYFMDKPLVLKPEDSGLTIRACDKETPVLSGGQPVTGWTKLVDEPGGVTAGAKGKLWTADIPKGWCFHYLYVDGVPMPRAKLHNTHWRKWPTDFTRGKPTKNGQSVTFRNKAILQNIPTNGDVEMVCIMAQYGVMGNGVMTQINPASGTAVWNSNQTHLGFRTRDPNRYTLENALPFIDQPGEWAVDSTLGKIYYWPALRSSTSEVGPASDDPNKSQIIAPKVYELIRLQGDDLNVDAAPSPRSSEGDVDPAKRGEGAASTTGRKGKRVENITIDGLTMVYTDRLPENLWPKNWIVRQWEHPDATVYLEGAKGCSIRNCRLIHPGASGITLNQDCQDNTIDGCEIGWPGSDGIYLMGYGPGTLDVNKNNTIIRNWIHDMGQGNYWHSNAIQIYQSGHNRIALNLFQRSAYCCISIVGAIDKFMNDPKYFSKDHPDNADRQFSEWCMFGIRTEDFSKEIQEGVLNKKYRFNRETIKPYLHSRENIIENNIVIEPEQLLDEGGAIYAWGCGKGNIWRDNIVFKSSGMPGSSILALDDVAEYFTITGNVIWVNGSARCGTIGMRPNERGNVIHDNIRAAYKPEHADGGGNANGIRRGFYKTDPTRDPVYKLESIITEKVRKLGGWPANPDTGIPRPGEEIKDAKQRTLPKGAHVTIE